MGAVEEIVDPRHIAVKCSANGVKYTNQAVYSLAVVSRKSPAALAVTMERSLRCDSSFQAAPADKFGEGLYCFHRESLGHSPRESDLVEMLGVVQIQEASKSA